MKYMEQFIENPIQITVFDLNTQEAQKKGMPEINPADSILIRYKSKSREYNILIDSGKRGQGAAIIQPFLIKNDVMIIHKLIISHPHLDHFGGIMDMIINDNIIIEEIVYAPIEEALIGSGDDSGLSCEWWKELMELVKEKGIKTSCFTSEDIGSKIVIDNDLHFVIVSAPDSTGNRDSTCNDLNLIVKLCYKGFSALFTGDCGLAQSEMILNSSASSLINGITLLKVPHHGAIGCFNQGFLDKCNPKIIVITSNEVATKFHGYADNFNKYTECGAKVYRTDLYFDLSFITDGNTVAATGRTLKYSDYTIVSVHL